MKRATLLLTDSTASCIVMGRVVYGEKDAIPKPKSTLKTCQMISALILQNRKETLEYLTPENTNFFASLQIFEFDFSLQVPFLWFPK